MLAYTTKRINYLYGGSDTLFKRILKSLFFTKSPYVRNTSLRKYGIKFKKTKIEKIEWNKCKDDIIYFAESYCLIPTERGIVNIKLRDYQADLLLSLVKDKRLVILNSRQMGISMIFRIYILWLLLFHSESICTPQFKMDYHYHNMNMIKDMYLRIPYFMQKGAKTFNQISIELEDSRVSNKLHKPTSVIVDNAAFFRDLNELDYYVKLDSKIVIASTPKGLNYFYGLWLNSNTYNLKPIRIHFSLNPEYNQEWIKKMIGYMGESGFRNEFDLSFNVE